VTASLSASISITLCLAWLLLVHIGICPAAPSGVPRPQHANPGPTPALTLRPPSAPPSTPTPTPAATSPTPTLTPTLTPTQTPTSTPASTPATTPASTPATTPASTPASTPVTTPASTPATTSTPSPTLTATSIPTVTPPSAPPPSSPNPGGTRVAAAPSPVTAGASSTSLAVALPVTRAGRPAHAPSRRPSAPQQPAAPPGAGLFRGQANMFLPDRSKLVPAISLAVLLIVVLIPCAAVAATRYKKPR